MNSAKKIMNQQNAGEKNPKHVSAAKGNSKLPDGGVSDVKKIVIGAVCVLIVLVLCIGVGVQQLKPKVVLTVDNKKFTLDDMMYPIYEKESTYLPLDQMYQMYTGKSVWENSYMGSDRNVDSSSSNADGLKQEIMTAETQYQILSDEAKKANYTLTEEDKEDIKEKVSEALKGLSWGQKLRLNISRGKLTRRYETRVLADKFQADKVNELNATVDEKNAVKDISKKDYREYKIQYYSASTTKTDDEGKTTKMTAKEKGKLLDKLKTVAKKAKTAKDFTDLIDEKEEDIHYADNGFTEKDGWSLLSDKKLLKQVKSMKNGTISGILEDKKNGTYLVVKMIDNNSSAVYKETCDKAVEDAQNAVYDDWYHGVLENHTVKIEDEIWDTIEIGTVTTEIVTADDLEKMHEDSSDATSN